MAIYHLTCKTLTVKSGRSVVAAAAYRARGRMVDEITGEIHDYRAGEDDHRKTYLLGIPYNLDAVDNDPQKLWNLAQKAEGRANGTIAREIEVALPAELDPYHQESILNEFVLKQFVPRGMIAQVSIHEGLKSREENPHAHILLTTRKFDHSKKEFITKRGHKSKLDWAKRETLLSWREAWAETVNKRLEPEMRIDHRSLKAQGITDRLPQIHEGPMVQALERKGFLTAIRKFNLEQAKKAIDRRLKELQLYFAKKVIRKQVERGVKQPNVPVQKSKVIKHPKIPEQGWSR